MSLRMRVLHSLVLGLIGLSLILYTTPFSSPFQIYRIEPHVVHETVANVTINRVSSSNRTEHDQKRVTGSGTGVGAAVAVADSVVHASRRNYTVSIGGDVAAPASHGAVKDSGAAAHRNAQRARSAGPERFGAHAAAIANSQQRGVLAKEVYDSGHVIPNADLCPELGRALKLMVLITSSPNHSEPRMAIRQTWGHFSQRRDIGVAFVVGVAQTDELNRAIAAEMEMYGDIIQARLADVYDNLTLKTISMFEWVDNYCPLAPFVLKTDDDMFINVPKLLALTEKQAKAKRSIFGRLARKWKPIRNNGSKYYVSVHQYPQSYFPDFTTGPAYLVTQDAVHDLYVNALNATFLKLEDVFMTGVVAQNVSVKRTHVNEFFNKRIPYNVCNVRKAISIHMVKFHEQFILWEKLHDTRVKCK